jgi:hypothetical protein
MALYSYHNIPTYITIIEAIFHYSKPKYLKQELSSAHNANSPIAHAYSFTYLLRCDPVSLGEQVPDVPKDHLVFLCRVRQNKAHISHKMAHLQLIIRSMQTSVPCASHPPGLGYNDIRTT